MKKIGVVLAILLAGLSAQAALPRFETLVVQATDMAGNAATSAVKVLSTGGAATHSYAHDADGNQSFSVEGLTRRTNTWDAENRLIRIDYTNGHTRFRYDGWGRLREVAEYNATNALTNLVRYAWNGFLPWAELNSTNGVVRTFTWGVDISGTLGGAGGIGGLVGIRQSGTNYLVRGDGRGNVTEVRRTNGTVIASYGYSPFGQLLYQTNTLAQPFRFSTRMYHGRSGLLYLVGRWYDPNTGRFLSRDPSGENGGINLYQAFAGNPINFADPDGEAAEIIVDVASIGWSAVDLWRDPSWANAGFLAWDIGAAAIPFVPGSYVAKGAKACSAAAKTPATVDRIRNVAQQGYDYAVKNPRVQGLNRMQLGKDAEVQATRWMRRWAERNDVNLGPGGLQFQVRGANSVPDVVFDPARQIFDFKLTPRAVRPSQTQNFGTDFPGYNIEYIFGP